MEEDKELQEKLFNQPQEVSPEVLKKTQLWSKKMLDPDTCFVCKQPFDLSERMARILVQCGHTLCTTCLKPVTRYATSRCPLCLEILMNVSSADRMPPNPQPFSQLFMREKLDANVQTSDKEEDSDTRRPQSPSRQVLIFDTAGAMRVRGLRAAPQRDEALLLRGPPQLVLQALLEVVPRQGEVSRRGRIRDRRR